MDFLFIVGCVALLVAGHLLFKKGVLFMTAVGLLPWGYALSPQIELGFVCALGAAACWIKVFQHYRLSVAYPFMSLSFPLVALLSL